MRDFSRHKTLLVGVALSVAVHGAIAITMNQGGGSPAKQSVDKDPVTVDIEVAPPPPTADEPEQSKLADDDSKLTATDKDKDKDRDKGTAVAVVVPKLPPPPPPELPPIAKTSLDAGLPPVPDAGAADAGTAIASGGMDAGRDGPAIATGGVDAAPTDDAGAAIASGSVDAGPAVDAGTAIASGSVDAGPARDAGSAIASGGVDAGPAIASAGMDAGPAVDAGSAIASGGVDAGPARDAGTAIASGGVDAGPARDAGTAIASGGVDAGPARDAGTAIARSNDRDAGSAAAKHSRTSANLLRYAPAGATVTVLLRFDRLRGTEWARHTEDIFKPMPDYRSMMGGRTTRWSTLFDSMVISTPNPRDHRVTTVATRSGRSAAAMRKFLNKAGTTITWSATRGGALGRRRSSRLVNRSDRRVFLMPYPGWTVLTPPNSLGQLTQPSGAPLGAWPNAAILPGWLRRLRGIDAESGRAKGPALMLSLRKLPPTISVRGLVSLRSPKRATLTMELAATGFIVRGTMAFTSDVEAKKFFARATKTRATLVKNFIARTLLKRFKAFNALKGLSLKRKGALITYATSISVADARRVFALAASWTKKAFQP